MNIALRLFASLHARDSLFVVQYYKYIRFVSGKALKFTHNRTLATTTRIHAEINAAELKNKQSNLLLQLLIIV